VRGAKRHNFAIPFNDFRSTAQKIRHAFKSIPAGKGLLTPCNRVIRKEPPSVYLHQNIELRMAISDIRAILCEATKSPTMCKELVTGPTDFVGIKDASIHGVGGIIVGEGKPCVPTVFRMQWPQDIKDEVLKTNAGLGGKLTNSDLEMAGLLLLWLMMEEVCLLTPASHVALFSDNSPTVQWVRKLAAKSSLVAGQLLRALSLRLKVKKTSPLTTMHIEGSKNALTDVPSRSFGSNANWKCENDNDLRAMFNKFFPLPSQNSWTVCRPTNAICTRVISILRMQAFGMDAWRRLPRTGRLIGPIGAPMSNLWGWTLTFRTPLSESKSDASLDLRQDSEVDTMVAERRSEVTRWQRRSVPLARRSRWTATSTQSR
jgi:hypothetical protein